MRKFFRSEAGVYTLVVLVLVCVFCDMQALYTLKMLVRVLSAL